jgi:hypothetical protein
MKSALCLNIALENPLDALDRRHRFEVYSFFERGVQWLFSVLLSFHWSLWATVPFQVSA